MESQWHFCLFFFMVCYWQDLNGFFSNVSCVFTHYWSLMESLFFFEDYWKNFPSLASFWKISCTTLYVLIFNNFSIICLISESSYCILKRLFFTNTFSKQQSSAAKALNIIFQMRYLSWRLFCYFTSVKRIKYILSSFWRSQFL